MKKTIHFKSIAIIVCYYGEFPWYFNYFLHSCKYNSTVDFIVITDNEKHYEIPDNVKIINIPLPKLKQMISKKMEFDVNIDFPYKLCDFKPAYGLIFSEFIEGYDFWGHSDIDIIYGNIRHFLDDEMLDEFDFISIRHDYTTGCFAVFKNNNQMKNIFKESKDYKKVFTNHEHFCFDECNFAFDLLNEGKSILEIETEIESFSHVIKSLAKENKIKAHFDFILMEGLPGKIKFDHGRIVYRNTFEAILYHLYHLKRIYHPKHPSQNIPDSYNISPTRIYT